jgi:hypothetical protein
MVDSDDFYDGNHPDVHKLNDWQLYGPSDPEIAELVHRLAYEKGMRLAEIERKMVEVLRKCLE